MAASVNCPPQLLRKEMAMILHRAVFEDMDVALRHSAAYYDHARMGVCIRAAHGEHFVEVFIPSDALTSSLDYLSNKYLQPAATELMHKVWSIAA